MATRFGTCPEDVREWAEKAGHENLRFRIESAGLLAAQAATTLTVVLAGLGGAMAYAVRVAEPHPGSVAVGAAVLCVHLAGVASLLVWKCMSVRAVPTPYNQPSYLLVPGTLEQLRVGELANLEMRIRDVVALSMNRAVWLNRSRALAISSPLVFVAGAVASRYL